MRILVTGANGFIGKNLVIFLNEHEKFSVLSFTRGNSLTELQEFVEQADAVVHLAGENRPKKISEFETVNLGLTQSLCDFIRSTGRMIPLILASSTQAEMNNHYAKSKVSAEKVVELLSKETNNPVCIYRLPAVFGKWSKPNYNSVVATFCFNIANNLPIQVNDGMSLLRLVYIDDVVLDFVSKIEQKFNGVLRSVIKPEYSISLDKLAEQIKLFKASRSSLVSELVGEGLLRALYSTYVSYIPPENFVYDLPSYSDERGSFVEILKTKNSGQFSFFRAHQGVTRGGHYHHSKTEKFLVVKGSARFRFRHIHTNEIFEIFTSDVKEQVVDTIPGWSHEVTNIGKSEMIVFLWANEIFNEHKPDTIKAKV